MINLLQEIDNCKRVVIRCGFSECEFKCYIKSIMSDRGLLELDDDEADELADFLKKSAEIAQTNSDFFTKYFKETVNQYFGYL